MSIEITTSSDVLLLPFLQAEDEARAQELLAQLIADHVEPLVKNIVGFKLRVYVTHNASRAASRDAEDVCSEALLQFLTRLADLKNHPETVGIRNLRSYVAVVAYRACHLYLRRKYPQRYSLKNKLRYFLTHQTGFALWESAEAQWLAGFAHWQVEQPDMALEATTNLHLEEWSDAARTAINKRLPQGSASGASLLEVLTAIFHWTTAPVELDALVSAVATLWNLKDESLEKEHRDAEPWFEQLADTRTNLAREFDQRLYLQTLWSEIQQLTPRHVAALLLNLKDEQGNCAIDLFLITGVATFAELAVALDQAADWLAEIWNHLPMDDQSIAAAFGLQRQQVINLRKTARLRLARRMKELGF
ncbi:MAG: hypothetical protein HY231_06370 [Acidobacteria bacterium]|nr:hypothetical protein [Acidobacteriota bacterium]